MLYGKLYEPPEAASTSTLQSALPPKLYHRGPFPAPMNDIGGTATVPKG